jgi:hypothetical protein
MSRIPDHIENPAAYADAIDRRIKENARKTRVRKFAEAEPELLAALNDLWSPEWNDEVEEWQQDGSHNILHTMTAKQRTAILRKVGWLHEGYIEYGSLTEKQAEKAKEIIAEVKANVSRWEDEDELRKLNATPWPESRERVEYDVTVVSAKVKRTPSYTGYGGDDYTWKMTVQREDGSRAWCTVPSKLLDAVATAMQSAEEEGCPWSDERTAARYLRNAPTIRLRASWVRADDDPIFAFAKRPHFVGFMHDITGESLEALASSEEE